MRTIESNCAKGIIIMFLVSCARAESVVICDQSKKRARVNARCVTDVRRGVEYSQIGVNKCVDARAALVDNISLRCCLV